MNYQTIGEGVCPIDKRKMEKTGIFSKANGSTIIKCSACSFRISEQALNNKGIKWQNKEIGQTSAIPAEPNSLESKASVTPADSKPTTPQEPSVPPAKTN